MNKTEKPSRLGWKEAELLIGASLLAWGFYWVSDNIIITERGRDIPTPSSSSEPFIIDACMDVNGIPTYLEVNPDGNSYYGVGVTYQNTDGAILFKNSRNEEVFIAQGKCNPSPNLR